MIDNNKKYKLVKLRKTLIALGIAITIPISGLTIFTAKSINHFSSNNSSSSSYGRDSSATGRYVDSDNDHIEVEYSNEKQCVGESKTSTVINLNKHEYKEFVNELESYDYEFNMSKYYDLENVLKTSNNVQSHKKENSELISGGLLDANKLYSIVVRNNDSYMKQDKNSINVFFSNASNDSVRSICDLIAETYNSNKDDYCDIKEVSDTLTHLKIFQNNTTSSNAYVTDDLVFVFNPNMMEMFSKMQEMRNNVEDGINVDKTVFVHEIEHIFQNASNDFQYENGIEAGFCRKYNNVDVNSLWYTWLLEGSAEIKMSESLSITPKNYDKKISYIRSYNLSRIFESDYNVDDLVDSVFTNNLDRAFKLLNINDEISKIEFLQLMYSIEITQSNTDDFWKFYQQKYGKVLTDNEKDGIRMDIRTEVVKKLSEKYYNGLSKELLDGKIKDLETVFYLMRLWELDSYGHLNFTSRKEYEHATDFIIWQNNIQEALIKAIADSNNMSYDELVNRYNNYHMSLTTDGKIINNADFSDLTKEKQEYINTSYEKYSVTYFSKISTMTNYVNNSKSKGTTIKN